MSLSDRPLLIYNPKNLPEEELLESFIVRQKEFRFIFEDIESSTMEYPEQHYIIQGRRGQGKTTLLLKLFYEINRDTQLQAFVIPVMFNEEEHFINSLVSFWETLAEKLDGIPGFEGLYESIEEPAKDDANEEYIFQTIVKRLLENGKKVILLIDNIGHILDKLGRKEQQRLREVLITCAELRIIGASAEVLEYTFDYSKPFYEFFRIVQLKSLKWEDTRTLLLELGKKYPKPGVQAKLEQNPGHIEALRRLTGGVIRTIILLFEILMEFPDNDIFQHLEYTLDRVTLLYRTRMDNLSPYQQKIVNVIALNWDAVSVKEIVQKTRMESKAISSHLKQLEKNKIICKISTSTKNYLYQICERFFNIWYLMRYGRKHGKERVRWMVRFLEDWCNHIETNRLAYNHIENLSKEKGNPRSSLDISLALSYSSRISWKAKHRLISATRKYLLKSEPQMIREVPRSDVKITEKMETNYLNKDFDAFFKNLEKIKDGRRARSYFNEHNYPELYENAELYEPFITILAQKGCQPAMHDLALLYFIRRENKETALELAKEAYNDGDIDDFQDPGMGLLYYKNYLLIQLWNNHLETGIQEVKKLVRAEWSGEDLSWISDYLVLLIAKKQYHTVLKLFNENPHHLKDTHKPVYYALMHFLQDEFPNEYKKMGKELRQTVEEIISRVEQWEADYA